MVVNAPKEPVCGVWRPADVAQSHCDGQLIRERHLARMALIRYRGRVQSRGCRGFGVVRADELRNCRPTFRLRMPCRNQSSAGLGLENS